MYLNTEMLDSIHSFIFILQKVKLVSNRYLHHQQLIRYHRNYDAGIEIYSDGSGTSTHLPGGYGFVVLDNGELVYQGSGPLKEASNNVAELTAAIEGLKYVKDTFPGRKVTLVSDSMLVLNYAKGTWKVKAQHLIKLFIEIRKLYTQMGIKTRWVKGHSGNPHNVRADALARKARLSVV